ncbi:putative non-specific serine/threonine protein kinase [Helianthus debilis subsp. tardiflorus]
MSAQSSYSCFHLFLLVVLAFFRLCSSNQNSHHVLCNDVERQALLQFKHGLTNESQRLTSWIACDNSTGHVHRIHLPGLDGHCTIQDYYGTIGEKEALKQKLRGDISRSLLDLKQLKHLDLSCNDFGGIQVPKFIVSFQNLRYLNLSSSNFSGTVPPQLGNLSELHILCLCLGSFHDQSERTSMANIKWLSSLGMLHHLDMSGVDLSKLFRCELSNLQMYVPSVNLTSLSVLELSYNDFNSSVSQWIFSVTSLISLDLTECYFHGPIPSFRNLTSLELLHVSMNDFMNSSSIFQELSSSNLISLDISYCGISSSVLDSLQNLANLISLDLSENQLTKRIPKSLVQITCLGVIILDREQYNWYNSSFQGNLSFLRTLDLRVNRISGPIRDSIGHLSSLEELYIGLNRLDGSLPDSVRQLSKLTFLDFSYNLLTGIVTEAHFIKLVSLNYLDGSANKLIILRLQFANWIPPFQLRSLYLRNWVLGPQFPLWL